jgi:hypothetical protein
MDSEAASLRVETGTYDEAADLLRALSLRGVDGRIAVEVDVQTDLSEHGASPLEAVVALEGWLQDRNRRRFPSASRTGATTSDRTRHELAVTWQRRDLPSSHEERSAPRHAETG